jgi:hypothetical protein
MGKRLNLKTPQTYSEKLQWLKLYNRRPEYTNMVDKYAVKEYVASKIGKEYIIPTLGVWNNPKEIDWDSLPKQFVLKTTHDSGGIVICRDKEKMDKKAAICKLEHAITHDNYSFTREWPYKDVPRKIIAEQYIESNSETHDLPDFKFFCFNGEVKWLFIATDRNKTGEEVKFDFYDADFKHLSLKQGHENAVISPTKPESFELMKSIASKLSEGIPHVRVDLYEVGGHVYFGELTFFHFSGMVPFRPEVWDREFGKMIKLPSNT